ncbi:MAG: hypothetical protein NTU61_00665 [Candidatus Altiarchaeota archaeon]|nr:hypothetical protein [Candidatus Altiarchaeota archaeon]
MVVESMTEFQRRMYTISSEISQRITEKSQEVREKELPGPMQLKVAPKPPITRRKLETGLDWPSELSAFKGSVHERDYADTIMSSVSDLRGPDVTITSMSKGHREDGRDFILQGVKKQGRASTNVDDMRIVFGDQDKVKNEVLAGRIMRELNLPFYSEQGVIYPSPAERRKVA